MASYRLCAVVVNLVQTTSVTRYYSVVDLQDKSVFDRLPPARIYYPTVSLLLLIGS